MSTKAATSYGVQSRKFLVK